MTPQEAIEAALREIEPDGKGITVVNLENIKALLASALDELAERDKQIKQAIKILKQYTGCSQDIGDTIALLTSSLERK